MTDGTSAASCPPGVAAPPFCPCCCCCCCTCPCCGRFECCVGGTCGGGSRSSFGCVRPDGICRTSSLGSILTFGRAVGGSGREAIRVWSRDRPESSKVVLLCPIESRMYVESIRMGCAPLTSSNVAAPMRLSCPVSSTRDFIKAAK